MPLFEPPRLLRQGDAAVTLQWGDEVSDEAHARVVGCVQSIERAIADNRLHGVRACVPAFASLTVHFDEPSAAAWPVDASLSAIWLAREALLVQLARAAKPVTRAGRRWCVPVCFDADFAPDLPALAAAKGLSERAAIEALLAARLKVYMLGFMPGFAYMGGVPAMLQLPRRSTPRPSVPPRSLAVAGAMAGFYPWASPGGWHLVGRTPLALFDPTADEPALLAAGDEVQLQAMDRGPFEALDGGDRRPWLVER
jgi:inhibitor of KinA